jgi:hypothetical protein
MEKKAVARPASTTKSDAFVSAAKFLQQFPS